MNRHMLPQTKWSTVSEKFKTCGGKRLHEANSSERHSEPLVSVITAVFNGEGKIRECLKSVIDQEYPFIEHIIVDGGSSDGTIDVLRQYEDKIALWISEPDGGVYDAWNKGLASARGEWVAFLGADDVFLPGAISAYMDLAARNPDAQFLSSVARWEHQTGYSRLFGEGWQWPRFSQYMCTAHPGSMHRRSLFTDYGTYNTSYKITADYELLLRAGVSLKAAFMPVTTVAMQAGGLSDSFRALREASRARVETGGQPAGMEAIRLFVAVVKRIIRKIFLRVLQKSST
jgi:glycosyltransferase involved in cell wall biosynthesis